MYTCGWFMLILGRKQQNSVKKLSFNFKKWKKKREYKEQDILEEKENRKVYSSGYKELL